MLELQLVLCKEFILYSPFELYTLPSLHCNNNMEALALQANVAHFLNYSNLFLYSSEFLADYMAAIPASASPQSILRFDPKLSIHFHGSAALQK